MPIIDPHCHTTASDGMVSPAELVAAAVAARLDAIAVTDHDTMRSVREVQERGAAAGLDVIAGQEITTRWPAQTHLLAWFLEKPVRRGMSLEDTVDAIRDHGGLVIVPHPFMPVYFGSIQPNSSKVWPTGLSPSCWYSTRSTLPTSHGCWRPLPRSMHGSFLPTAS